MRLYRNLLSPVYASTPVDKTCAEPGSKRHDFNTFKNVNLVKLRKFSM
jgi:hypothetical protein